MATTTPTEEEAYAAFVDTCMHQLHAGLKLDQTKKKRRVADALSTHVINTDKSAAQRVLEGRFVLGADDAAYLQTGLATLWSTAATDTSTDGLDTGLALSPPGLYTPDAVGGIRAGLVRALKAKTKTLERNAPADLAALVPALHLLLETPVIRNAVIGGGITQQKLDTLLKYKWTDVVNDPNRETRRAELLEVLRKLKNYLEFTNNGTGGPKKIAELIVKAVEKQASQLATVEGELSTTQIKLKQRATELKKQKEIVTDMQSELDSLRTTLARAKAANAQAMTRIAGLQAAIKDANAEEARLTESLDECEQRKREALAKITDLEELQQVLRDELEDCKASEDSLLAEMGRLTGEVAQLEEKLATSQSSDAAHVTELESTRVALAQHKALLTQREADLDKVKTSKAELVARLQGLESDNAAQKVKLEDQQRELNQSSVDVNTQRRLAAARSADLVELREEKRKLEEEKRNFGKQIVELEQVRDGMSVALASSQSRIVELETEVAGMQTDTAALQGKIAANEKTMNDLRGQLRNSNVDRDLLKRELEACEKQSEELRVEAERQAEKFKKCKRKLKELRTIVQPDEDDEEPAEPVPAPYPTPPEDPLEPVYEGAPTGDVDFSNWVVARGLVGQRGPACAAVTPETDAAIAAVDARLEYALPSPEALGAVLPHLKLLLDGTDEPTEAEVRAALPEDNSDDMYNTSTAVETLAAFKGNYAVLGAPVDANDDRGGIEVPHAVRWLPATGAAGRSAARVAMLEHVMARCAQLAESDATSTPVKAALREAAATLKLAQMAPLYATREAVAYDEPERSGCLTSLTTAERGILVTRPCAIVRGALAFPVDAGIARVASDRRAESVLGDAAEAKAAKAKCHEATLRVRTQARAEGRATNIYVAPPARELKFASVGTSATGVTLLSEDLEVTEDVTPDDFTAANWLRIVNRALVATSALLPENDAAVERVEGLLAAVGEEGVTAEQRRDGLWTEFRRHAAISQDRLWVFLRLLSGAVGGEVNEIITMADEATLRATKAIQDQRVTIAKRVSDMQSKIVETVVGSMAKESKLTLDKNGTNQLVVVDGETRKQLNDLASGESGRPFFEANVAVRNLQSSDASAPKPTLSQLLASLSQVGGQMQRSLEQTLAPPGTASASLAELSHPANCYFVTLRPDAVAAIRIAHERMNVELGLRGAGRRLSLWETIEGGCTMLTTRFAEFTGHVLVQARSTTGVSAMYVSPQAMHTNAIQARVALERLVHAGGAYTYGVSEPNWTALRDSNANLGEARGAIMDAGSQVEDHDVGMIMRRAIQGAPTRSRLSTHRHASGWEVVGLATR